MKILNKFLAIAVTLLVSLGLTAMPAEAASRHHGASRLTVKSKGKAPSARQHVRYAKGKRMVLARQHAAPAAPEPEFDAEGDPILRSQAFLVQDQTTGTILLEKNSGAVLPIASITKLMTAMVVLDARQSLADQLEVSDTDVDYLRGSSSRLAVGSVLSREDMLRLALMSSENRAAAALARYYPGGTNAFVDAMNRKAATLGLHETRFYDSTGLNAGNVSSARDLVQMVGAAAHYPLIREFSTSAEYLVEVGGRLRQFHNTNPLVANADWQIGVSKTGYIRESGKCLVMQAWLKSKPLIIVLLDSAGRYTRVADAARIKRWLEGALLTHGDQPLRLSARQSS
jgi:D-alanyl-D-alanine endopeptidase (penicillin-binding protein 7)